MNNTNPTDAECAVLAADFAAGVEDDGDWVSIVVSLTKIERIRMYAEQSIARSLQDMARKALTPPRRRADGR